MQAPEQLFEDFRERGDAAALAALFDDVAPELLLVAAHVAPRGVEPEDLLQATFVDAIEHAARWDATRRLMPWLIGVLLQHARVERRKLARRIDESRLVERDVEDPARLVESADVGRRVAAAVASMPVRYRQVLTLRLVHGLLPMQIATALGCPVATVKTRLQRGMELLRGTLPVGLATSLALLCFGGRGLAQVKTAVLAKAGVVVAAPLAATSGAVAAATAGWLGGSIVMKKFAVACVALALLVLGFAFSPWGGSGESPAPRPVDLLDAPFGSVVSAPTGIVSEPADVRDGAPAAREQARLATADALLTFVWKHDGSPASGLRVMARANVEPAVDAFVGRADREGRLQLAALEPGEYLFHGFRFWQAITLAAGQRVEQRIEVDAGMRCEGVVVDASGRGVAGADVFVQYFPDVSDSPRWLARSGADGTFRCATDSGGSFWARKAGFVVSAIQAAESDDAVMLRLQLGGSGAALHGRIQGLDCRGLGGARVLVLAQGDPGVCPAPIEVVADAAGVYGVDELGEGPHLLVVEADGHAASALPFVMAGRSHALDVRLGSGAIVEGTVHDRDRRPMAAIVQVRPAWAGSETAWSEALRPIRLRCATSASTTSDGSYRLEHVPVGAIEVIANAGRSTLAERRELLVGERETIRCDFWLGGSGAIRGRLVDPLARALAGWRISCDPIGGGRAASSETDADGAFAAAGLDAETYRVTASPPDADGSLPWATVDDVRCGTEVLLRAVCVPADAARLRGIVRRSDGTAARRLRIGWMLAGARQGVVRPVPVADDGTFASGPVPPGRYRLTAMVEEEGGVDLGSRDLIAGVTADVGEVRVAMRGMLDLRFRTADGSSVSPEELHMFGVAGNHCDRFDEVGDGSHRSAPVPAGRYSLVAWGPGFARVSREVVVVAGRTEAVEVSVPSAITVCFEAAGPATAAGTRRLRLRVFDGEGRATGGASQLLLEPGRPGRLRRGFAPGSYRFEVHENGRPVGGGVFAVAVDGREEVAVRIPVAD